MTQGSVDVLEFKGEYEKFSNFYQVTIHYKRRTFQSVELAYVSEKSNNNAFKNRIASLKGNQSGYAKKLGRQVQLRKDWDDDKDKIMTELLLIKFNIPEFHNLLLSTRDGQLVEGNYWHDNYWGDCYCKKCQNKKGLNKLGNMLMDIRENTVRIFSPWTQQEVENLNARQKLTIMHPYTCAKCGTELVAKFNGWHCPNVECNSEIQNWALRADVEGKMICQKSSLQETSTMTLEF